MPQPESTISQGQNPNYREVDIIRDPEGVIAVITERKKDGAISFGIYQEFNRNGEVARGSFLARRHIQAARRVLDDLEERLEAAESAVRAKPRDEV